MKMIMDGMRRMTSEQRRGRPRADSPGEPHDHTYTIRIEPAEIDGGYIAEVLDLPGCMSQGETVEDAYDNVVDALKAVLEASGASKVSVMDPKVPAAGDAEPRRPTSVPLRVCTLS